MEGWGVSEQDTMDFKPRLVCVIVRVLHAWTAHTDICGLVECKKCENGRTECLHVYMKPQQNKQPDNEEH